MPCYISVAFIVYLAQVTLTFSYDSCLLRSDCQLSFSFQFCKLIWPENKENFFLLCFWKFTLLSNWAAIATSVLFALDILELTSTTTTTTMTMNCCYCIWSIVCHFKWALKWILKFVHCDKPWTFRLTSSLMSPSNLYAKHGCDILQPICVSGAKPLF